MNNFLLEYAPPKSQPSQKVLLARVYFAAFRQDSCAGHGYFYAGTEYPYKSKMGSAGFMTRPLKRKWGKVLPDKFKLVRGDKWPTAFIVRERRFEIHGLF